MIKYVTAKDVVQFNTWLQNFRQKNVTAWDLSSLAIML